ncbi:hypothetical protein JKG47_04725 [Acidithiobacillus sp. MC6.1]|nr:hypothetical protein [Acidithiobacillus sp. MC6.1]
MSNARQYLNTGDEYVSDILRLAAKAISEAYQTSYDMPVDLPDGWIGIRVDLIPERLKAVPQRDAGDALQRLLDMYNSSPSKKGA